MTATRRYGGSPDARRRYVITDADFHDCRRGASDGGARVYRATHEETERVCAYRVVPRTRALALAEAGAGSDDPLAALDVVGAVEIPGLVGQSERFIGVAPHRSPEALEPADFDEFVVVEEWVDGVPIPQLAADLSLDGRVRIIEQVATTIEELHRSRPSAPFGFRHRDVKAQNVLVDADLTATLIDRETMVVAVDASDDSVPPIGTDGWTLGSGRTADRTGVAAIAYYLFSAVPGGDADDGDGAGSMLGWGRLPHAADPEASIDRLRDDLERLGARHPGAVARHVMSLFDADYGTPRLDRWAARLRHLTDGSARRGRSSGFLPLNASRRYRKAGLVVGAGLVLLALVATGVIGLVRSARSEADERAKDAAAFELAAQAQAEAVTNPALGFALAASAAEQRPALEELAALRSELAQAALIRPWQSIGPQLPAGSQTIRSVAISPDNATLVSGGEGSAVVFWDRHTGTEVARVAVQNRIVNAVEYNPGGDRLAVALDDGTVEVLDPQQRQPALDPIEAHVGATLALGWSPSGDVLATTGSDRSVRLWTAATGALYAEPLEGHRDWVRALAFRPDGSLLVTGDNSGALRIWDPVQATLVDTIDDAHAGFVWGVAFDPTGQQFASVDSEGVIRVWDSDTTEMEWENTGHEGGVLSVTFSADGAALLSTGADGTARLWRSEDGQPLGRPLQRSEWLWDASFAADGAVLIGGAQGEFQLWDPPVRRLGERDAGDRVQALAYAPAGGLAAAGTADGTLWLWRSAALATRQALPGHDEAVFGLDFSADGELLASSDRAGIVQVWSSDDPREPLQVLRHAAPVWSVAFLDGDAILAAGMSTGQVVLWEPTTGRLVGEELVGHDGVVRTIAHHEATGRVATGSRDGTIRLWEVATGTELLVIAAHERGVRSLVFTPDGAELVSAGNDGRIRRWDPETGEEVAAPLVEHQEAVTALAFGPDGRLLYSAGQDGRVLAWVFADAELVGAVDAHSTWINALGVAPDGMSLLTGSSDSKIKQWNAALWDDAATCSYVASYVTRAQLAAALPGEVPGACSLPEELAELQ